MMQIQFSKRTSKLSSAIFAQLEQKKNELLARGREVINFSVGTPDLPPPPHFIQTLQEEVGKPENYIYALKDIPELVAAAQAWYERRFGVTLEPAELTSLMGSQDGLAHIPLTLADPGDVVLVPDPGYPIFSMGPFLAGAQLHPLPLIRENNFLVDFDRIQPTVAHQAKLIIVSYPGNPVTATAPPDFYEKLIWFARKYNIAVVHDNAYAELVFDGNCCGSFLSFPGAKEVGVEFNSLSKSYNVPGCRISFAMGNRDLIEQLRNLKSHLDYGIFVPLQKAAVAVLSGPQECVADTARTYQTRRDLLLDGLAAIGWPIEKPAATMFVWARIPDKYSSAVRFTMELLEKTGVIVVPGSSFGDGGEGYVRIALVQPPDKIQKAITLIKESAILN